MNEYGVIRADCKYRFVERLEPSGQPSLYGDLASARRMDLAEASKVALLAVREQLEYGIRVVRFIDTPGEDKIEVVPDAEADGWAVRGSDDVFATGDVNRGLALTGYGWSGDKPPAVFTTKAQAYGLIERGAVSRGGVSGLVKDGTSDYEVVGVKRTKSAPTTTYEVVV